MQDKASIISEACTLLLNYTKESAINVINSQYKYSYVDTHGRSYTEKQKMTIYLRDGFIDRYTGDKLVNPGILRVLSVYFPKDFPYQAHWKMTETHIAYWELLPTIDHIVPIAMGGEDNEENWVTTSMLHNSIKSNWTLAQIGWNLLKPGELKEWDGLTNLFIKLIEKDESLLKDSYLKRWYMLAKAMVIQ